MTDNQKVKKLEENKAEYRRLQERIAPFVKKTVSERVVSVGKWCDATNMDSPCGF